MVIFVQFIDQLIDYPINSASLTTYDMITIMSHLAVDTYHSVLWANSADHKLIYHHENMPI